MMGTDRIMCHKIIDDDSVLFPIEPAIRLPPTDIDLGELDDYHADHCD